MQYTVNGKTYNEILNDANGKMKEGDAVIVRYNPEKPSYVTATTKTGGLIRIAFGAVILGFGAVSFKRSAKVSKKEELA